MSFSQTHLRIFTHLQNRPGSAHVIRLSSLYLQHCYETAISQVFLSVCEHWQGGDLSARMLVPSAEPVCQRRNLVEVIPPAWRWLCYRQAALPPALTEQRFLQDLNQFDATYLFPGVSLATQRRIKALGKPIVLERVNTFTGNAKQILDDAYSRLGLPPDHPNTLKKIAQELEEVALADFLFCPSQLVKESFQAAGVPAAKLIATSEGWLPHRFSALPPLRPRSDRVTVLFLGTVCVRKGAHLLLRAWEKAQIQGQLILMGSLEPAIAQTCAHILDRSDVTHITHSLDYTQIYDQADIFALPSLEEGSPLVTYEAMSRGLPIVASPMGAGGIVRDGIDGTIVPPDAEQQWIHALRLLATNSELRQRQGAAARQQALEYTWDKVAARRAAQLVEKLQPAPALVAV